MKYNYILGLDVGISSVGWGLLALDENDVPYKIIDVGSRIFSPGEVEKTGDSKAKERREKRGARRVVRRREFRLDRVRNLLYENNFLTGNVTGDLVSIRKEELTEIYNNMINNYYKENNTNPYKLKVEALDRKLSKEELSIILVHYAKKRGYKSNRESASEKDSGKVLNAIKENISLMKDKNYRTISEMYIKDEKFKDKIKNSPENYKVSVTNEMYLDEINKVLDSQIKFGLIDNKFKEEYLKIYSSRRHYSEGPGYYYEYDENGNRLERRSKYGGDLIEKMVGKCAFDHKPRAPKYAFSSEIFVALSKLVNLRYKIGDGNYQSLTPEEIASIINTAKEKQTVTYKYLVKILGTNDVTIKNLNLTKSEYIKVIEEYKKYLSIPKEERVDISSLDENKRGLYESIYNDKLFSRKFIELKGYHTLKKAIVSSYNKEVWNEVKDNIEFLDELALYCTNYKINEDIQTKIKESEIIDAKFDDINFVEKLPNFKEHLMLSTDIIRDLIPLMMQGITYDKAMESINIDHSNVSKNIEKKNLLVPIYVDENIRNQRVIRSLTQTRKVLNAIIKKYGMPKIINIETARDLARTKDERNKIEKSQLERKAENEKIRKFLVEEGPFTDVNKISSNDLLKYKLWKEQNEFCGYSMEKIKFEELFTNNIVQIDHILPYSRTYNDNYLNKTLVYTKYNQDKGNKTPYEWFGNTPKWSQYESFINSLAISQNKKDNYLLTKLDLETEREMRNQNLNDTKYISRELASLIKAHLNVPKVNVYPGAITAKLRARWGFNRLTHSYISKTYIMPDDMKTDINKDRDNHLHHAMDALVIASITKSLEQKVTLYEKFSRYIDGIAKNKLNEIKIKDADDEIARFFDKDGVLKETEFKEYLKEQEAHDNIYFSKHGVSTLKFPLPYDNFVEEAKERVYEQNLEMLKWNLEAHGTYSKEELEKVHTLTPSLAKPKISGAMHKDTYYGMKTIETNDEKVTYKTLRTPIEKVKRKDLDNMPDRENGSKEIFNALVAWFGDCENGAEALKKHDGKYPINPNDKEQKAIKRIKVYSEFNNTGHTLNNANVEKGGIYRIDIFKSNNESDNKLYFAAYDVFEIEKIKEYQNKNNSSKEFTIKLEYGQGKNNKILPYSEVLNSYNLYMSLYKNDLIKVITTDGRESIAYVVGCSSGKLEVKSKLGDGYDIIGKDNIFSKINSRYQITVSTISSIQKLSINILGEISGV